jgi:Tol biopolymer transport system component
MIRKNIYKSLRPIISVIVGIVMVLSFLTIVRDCTAKTDRKSDYISGISFSPDGKKILFTRKKDDGSALLNAYNLETEELNAYKTPHGESWYYAQYSYDGKHIAFVIMPRKPDGYLDLENTQIAIMDSDGKNVRKITNSPGTRMSASFSHNGQKIIFAKAGMIRESGKTPAAKYDVWEVDVKTGKETRLTYYEFFLMSVPYYLPDDKRFIFKGESPSLYPDISDNNYDLIQKKRQEYKSKYGENWIFIMQEGEQTLKPFIVFPPENADRGRATLTGKSLITEKGKGYSDDPLITADGSRIFFLAHSYDYETKKLTYEYQYYEYSHDGNHRHIIKEIPGTPWDTAISPDSKQIAIVYHAEPERKIRKIMICTVKDGTCKEIALPDKPSSFIN